MADSENLDAVVLPPAQNTEEKVQTWEEIQDWEELWQRIQDKLDALQETIDRSREQNIDLIAGKDEELKDRLSRVFKAPNQKFPYEEKLNDLSKRIEALEAEIQKRTQKDL